MATYREIERELKEWKIWTIVFMCLFVFFLLLWAYNGVKSDHGLKCDKTTRIIFKQAGNLTAINGSEINPPLQMEEGDYLALTQKCK